MAIAKSFCHVSHATTNPANPVLVVTVISSSLPQSMFSTLVLRLMMLLSLMLSTMALMMPQVLALVHLGQISLEFDIALEYGEVTRRIHLQILGSWET